MIIKIVSIFITFSLCSEAFESPFGLDEKVKEGLEKISGFSKQSEKEISLIKKTIDEYKEYFDKSKTTYLNAGDNSRKNLTAQLQDMTIKFTGEAVDKNKNTNTFECIIKVKIEAETAIINSKNSAYQCANDSYTKQMKELENVEVQIDYVKVSTTDLYQQLTASLKTCSDENSVTKLIQTGETRLNNLKKVIQLFNPKISGIRSQFNQNQDNCLRNNQNGNQNSVKAAENKMKFC